MTFGFDGLVCGLAKPMVTLVFKVMNVFAGFKADLVRMRTREGMKIVKVSGRVRWKYLKLPSKQEIRRIKKCDSGDDSEAELAEVLGVACSLVGRAVGRVRGAA